MRCPAMFAIVPAMLALAAVVAFIYSVPALLVLSNKETLSAATRNVLAPLLLTLSSDGNLNKVHHRLTTTNWSATPCVGCAGIMLLMDSYINLSNAVLHSAIVANMLVLLLVSWQFHATSRTLATFSGLASAAVHQH